MTKKITLVEAAKVRTQNGAPDAEVLTAQEIAAVIDTPTLKTAAQKQTGRVLNDLLKNSARGDTRASVEILERGHGKVAQGVEVTGEFTIKALHAHVLAAVNAPIEPTPASPPARRVRPARV